MYAQEVLNHPFRADPDRCTACGKCVDDCVAGIIAIKDGVAFVAPEKREDCLGCQHCLAICPTASATIAGLRPEDSTPVGGCDPRALDLLFRSRRSVRQFAPGAVAPELLDRILDSVSYAPTGVNERYRRFTVIRDPKVMDEYRAAAYRMLAEANLSGGSAWIGQEAAEWLRGGKDFMFRTAPHCIVVTCAPGQRTPHADGPLAIAYFELLAQAHGLATVWWGMAEWMFKLVPATRDLLGIPADHTMGYAMLFGPRGVEYERTAQYGPEDLVYVENIG